VGTYLVEAYLARSRDSEPAQAASCAQAAADELSRQGVSVRYLRTIILPEEETCFHVYEAASADDVREACRRAGIACERVLDALDIAPQSTRLSERTNQKEKR
jgi:Protein of unknown function (DUF4242)